MLKNIFVLVGVFTVSLSYGAEAMKRDAEEDLSGDSHRARILQNERAELEANHWVAECPKLTSTQQTLYRNAFLRLIDNPAFPGLEAISVPGRIYSLGGALGSDENPLSLTNMPALRRLQRQTQKIIGSHNSIPFTGKEDAAAISWLLAKINPALPTVFVDQRTLEHQGRVN